MKLLIVSILISFIWNVECAATRKPDVAPIISPKTVVNDMIDDSLSAPSNTGKFGDLHGVVIEPVSISDKKLMDQISNTEVQVPILIKDDNLINKPVEVQEPILMNDTNLMINTNEEENVAEIEKITSKDKTTELPTPTTPGPVPTTTVKTATSEQNVTPEQPEPEKPCPNFRSRYEEGKFIMTLDYGKCEMVVGEKIIAAKKANPWATGKFTPIYQLLSRKYKPEVSFRRTASAPADYNCMHHTRQVGSFFVVDTVLGKCQMVIGIPTLPDLRYIMSSTKPTWNKPIRKMPTWPRVKPSKQKSSDSESED